MSDTWVAMDGGEPTTFFNTCWICDCGPYIGPVPAVLRSDASWLPADAGEIIWLVALPKPGGDAAHVADGTYSTLVYYQTYQLSGATEAHSPSDINTGAHLFATWFDPAFPADPADLATPSASPLDMVPADLVSGGRLVTGIGAVGPFAMPITMQSVRVVGDSIGLMSMPITMPAVQPVTASSGASIGVFAMPINMAPMFLQVAGPGDPPADWSDLGPPDPVYSEDGPP